MKRDKCLSLFESFQTSGFTSRFFIFSFSKLVAIGSSGGEEIITIGDLQQCFLCLIWGFWVSFEEKGYFFKPRMS